MKKANAITRDALKRDPTMSYIQSSVQEKAAAMVSVFSDASLKKVAQEGCIAGIAFGSDVDRIFYTIAPQSHKQYRVVGSDFFGGYSSGLCAIYPRILHGDDRSENLTDVFVDSKCLHRCLAAQSTPNDRGVIADVHLPRAEFESGSISDIIWVSVRKTQPRHSINRWVAKYRTA